MNRRHWVVTGKWLDSPEKRNVDKMPGKCPKNVRKNVQKWSRGTENTSFRQFLPIWSMLLLGDPVQCSPVTIIGSGGGLLLTYDFCRGEEPEALFFGTVTGSPCGAGTFQSTLLGTSRVAKVRTRRNGANPEKSDLVNFRGPD